MTATQGPWRISEHPEGAAFYIDGPGDSGTGDVAVLYRFSHTRDAIAHANAKLIAAAPALADALERAMGCIHGLLMRTPVRDVDETEAEARAALTLAGRRPQ